ncbi:hypothetical protein [Streptomyces sp. NPDC005784]|uniref:hypothetical protein n=1 Tax=Streptomyces sp. NPDC005784 TaxID=3364731 RepID=UPI0036884E42
MSVLNYRPFSHRHDESDHLVGPRPRGESRRNKHRIIRRRLKRADTRAWHREADTELSETGE